MRALAPWQVTPTAVCGTQTMTMRQAKSRRDAPSPPRYAMSGFQIEMGGFLYAAAIDARHRTGRHRHDMAAEFQ
jgi:hypothetical protein